MKQGVFLWQPTEDCFMAKKKKKLQTMEARFRRAVHYKGKLKRYTIKEYKNYINKCERLANGHSSRDEKIVAKRLEKMDVYRLIDGQLKLDDYWYKGDDHEYYPDFIMLDYHKRIVVIEVKSYIAMAEEKNLKKYEMTKKFCEKHGFKYAWITKEFQSLESIKRAKYNNNIYKNVLACFKRHGKFTVVDLDRLKEKENYTHKYLNKQITIICLKKNFLMKGNLTHERKKLCIKKR